MATYHSLRALAEVELAMCSISEERAAEAAMVLDGISSAGTARHLGPRIDDAIDRAWTELHLGVGDLGAARRSAQRMRVGFWRDATLAKVLLAEGDMSTAAGLLDSLAPTSPRQRVTGLLLQSIAEADQDPSASEAKLASALATAAHEGILQTVIAAGPALVELLESASWAVPDAWMTDVRRLLAKGRSGTAPQHLPTLYEQPTERERTVARYLASRLTVPEIARELSISPNTLKTHVSSLYRKLDVTSREAAVATARRLGIIG